MHELNAIGKFYYLKYSKWNLVYVLSGGPFSNDIVFRNKRHLNDSLGWLLCALNDFIKNNRLQDKNQQEIFDVINERGSDNLNHGKNILSKREQAFIAKCPVTNPEIRMLYSFEYGNGDFKKLKVYDFRTGGFDHAQYLDEFRSFYDLNKNGNFVPYLQIRKEF